MNETHIGECNLSKTYAPMYKPYMRNKTSRYEGYNTQMHNHHVYSCSHYHEFSEIYSNLDRKKQSPSMPMSSKVAEHGQSSFECICVTLTLCLQVFGDSETLAQKLRWWVGTHSHAQVQELQISLKLIPSDLRRWAMHREHWTIRVSSQSSMLTHWTSWILTCAVNKHDSSFTKRSCNEEAKFKFTYSWRTQIVLLRL